jgi:hypothetical protein
MQPVKHIILILSCSALLSGCATIIRGTSENFMVDSIPQGANVQMSTGQSGVTPFRVKVPRSQTLQVSISKTGYKSQRITVPAEVSSGGAVATAANLFAFRDLGGLLGAAVDASDGSAMEHKPNPLVVQLEKQ